MDLTIYEGPEGIKNKLVCGKLKSLPDLNFYYEPGIMLKGKWLNAACFYPGNRVKVHYTPGVIIITHDLNDKPQFYDKSYYVTRVESVNQINKINLVSYITNLGIQPIERNTHRTVFPCPFSWAEKGEQIIVEHDSNTWRLRSSGEGGGTLFFAAHYHKTHLDDLIFHRKKYNLLSPGAQESAPSATPAERTVA